MNIVKRPKTGKKIGNLTLAVPSFKNMDGLYETDFVSCILWDEKAAIAKSIVILVISLVLKGRLQSKVIENRSWQKKSIRSSC